MKWLFSHWYTALITAVMDLRNEREGYADPFERSKLNLRRVDSTYQPFFYPFYSPGASTKAETRADMAGDLPGMAQADATHRRQRVL